MDLWQGDGIIKEDSPSGCESDWQFLTPSSETSCLRNVSLKFCSTRIVEVLKEVRPIQFVVTVSLKRILCCSHL